LPCNFFLSIYLSAFFFRRLISAATDWMSMGKIWWRRAASGRDGEQRTTMPARARPASTDRRRRRRRVEVVEGGRRARGRTSWNSDVRYGTDHVVRRRRGDPSTSGKRGYWTRPSAPWSTQQRFHVERTLLGAASTFDAPGQLSLASLLGRLI